ncbi:MAG: tRNA lysidine(34) synthetase TilS, partial [Firmicutes bacterium]|nr:tRNA lysidine(34) synthetase TilS [Bacillota bacterium]
RELNPRLAESASATIRSLREDEAYLTARALEVFREALPAEEGLVLPTKRLSLLPTAIAVRVIRRMLEGIEAPPPTGAHITGILEVIRGRDPSASIRLPGGVLVSRVYEEVLFAYESSQEPLPPFDPLPLNRKGKTVIHGTGWSVICEETVAPGENPDGAMYLKVEALSGALTLRPRQTGDVLALPGRRSKSLKKLMIEEKVPRRDRERIPVLDAGGELAAVAGLGPHRAYLAQSGEAALALRFLNEE